MRVKKEISIKRIIFDNYAVLIISLILLLFLSTFIFFVNDRISKITELQTNLCDSAKNSIESSIEKMSIVSMNSLYSKTIRKTLRSVDPLTANIKTMDPIYEAISYIIGPYGTVTQVNIHSTNNYQVGWGVYELFAPENYKKVYNYDKIKVKNGFKYIDTPRQRKDLAYYNKYLSSKKFISLNRIFKDPYYQEEGIVEVIQDCDSFFGHLNLMKKENKDIEFYIYNEDNVIIYPYNEVQIENQFTDLMITELKKSPVADKVKPVNVGNKYYASFVSIDEINWKVVVKQNKTDAFHSLITFIVIYSLIGFSFLGLAVLMVYAITRKVTTPIYKLKETIKAIDLNDIINNRTEITEIETKTSEIAMLSRVFKEMYLKLEVSTKDLMTAREEELRAKFIAMQSMINPHFIFNNLANISVMAEENMNDEIVKLSKNLCDYLRYISADSLTTVDTLTEVYYAEKYLECMKVRYGSRLEYYFDIPTEMEKINISKLTIQPIIENSLKYAFQDSPPWVLEILGNIYPQGWELIIRDNGIGIKEEYIKEIEDNQKRIKETKNISSMKIGGMGLANVYLRLILLHGNDAQLIIRNRAGGGTEVIIRSFNLEN